MHRRSFLTLTALSISGCGFLRIDPNSVFIRSDIIDSPEREKEVLAKGRVGWTEDGKIRVLYASGTPYEVGYQHGALLRDAVCDNLESLYNKAMDQFYFPEIFAEVYERMSPFIPQHYIQEMHGLAHGSRLPLHLVHAIHVLPEIGEWGGKKKVKKIIKQMMSGELATSCSNLSARGDATADGKPYVVRILDWGLHKISKLHKYPLIAVVRPSEGVPYANIGWAGFLGAVSGMNAEGITLGEMGYNDPPNETLRGEPMPFVLRDVLLKAHSVPEARKVIGDSIGTNSFVFLIADGKTGESELYVKDRDRFRVFKPGEEIRDEEELLPGIRNIVYGGHFRDKMSSILQAKRGAITPDLLMNQIIPELAMKSNFQNVVYSPSDLTFWVNNAKDKNTRAAEQPYTFFDLKKALATASPPRSSGLL